MPLFLGGKKPGFPFAVVKRKEFKLKQKKNGH